MMIIIYNQELCFWPKSYSNCIIAYEQNNPWNCCLFVFITIISYYALRIIQEFLFWYLIFLFEITLLSWLNDQPWNERRIWVTPSCLLYITRVVCLRLDISKQQIKFEEKSRKSPKAMSKISPTRFPYSTNWYFLILLKH